MLLAITGLYFFDNSTTPSSTARRRNTPTLMSSVDCLSVKMLRKESSRDPTLTKVMRFAREDGDDPAEKFRKIANALSVSHFLFSVWSPSGNSDQATSTSARSLARMPFRHPTDVTVGKDGCLLAEHRFRHSRPMPAMSICAGHQFEPLEAAVHPWMLPEKPWSRLRIDHAINFLGHNWLVVTDAYNKYLCIHATQSDSAKSTIKLLQEDFAHFGFPQAVVADCAAVPSNRTRFRNSAKRMELSICLTGAPYHPATNGAAERLVQTFKQKSA